MASTLKVNEIQHTNGTSAMTIDTNGVISQPVKPAFHCKKDSAQTTSANNEQVTWDTVFLN